MGFADVIQPEDRVSVVLKVTDLKELVKGCVQRDLLLNGIKTRTSHEAMYQMMTGEYLDDNEDEDDNYEDNSDSVY